MHYKDGTPARAGDLVLNTQSYSSETTQLIGVLTKASPNSTACNGTINPVARRVKSALGWAPWQPVISGNDWSVTLSDCERLGETEPEQSQPESTKEVAPTAA